MRLNVWLALRFGFGFQLVWFRDWVRATFRVMLRFLVRVRV